MILIIIPCGQQKIWKKHPNSGPTEARCAYTGAPFKVNKKFAEKFAEKWMILSAKHGFIEPNFMIRENYNVTFKKRSTKPITLEDLKKQAKQKNLLSYSCVLALGGKDYSNIVKEIFANSSTVFAPAKGLQVGKGMHRIKELSGLQKEEMMKEIENWKA